MKKQVKNFKAKIIKDKIMMWLIIPFEDDILDKLPGGEDAYFKMLYYGTIPHLDTQGLSYNDCVIQTNENSIDLMIPYWKPTV